MTQEFIDVIKDVKDGAGLTIIAELLASDIIARGRLGELSSGKVSRLNEALASLKEKADGINYSANLSDIPVIKTFLDAYKSVSEEVDININKLIKAKTSEALSGAKKYTNDEVHKINLIAGDLRKELETVSKEHLSKINIAFKQINKEISRWAGTDQVSPPPPNRFNSNQSNLKEPYKQWANVNFNAGIAHVDLDEHIGDIYTILSPADGPKVENAGREYRFVKKSDGNYEWSIVGDTLSASISKEFETYKREWISKFSDSVGKYDAAISKLNDAVSNLELSKSAYDNAVGRIPSASAIIGNLKGDSSFISTLSPISVNVVKSGILKNGRIQNGVGGNIRYTAVIHKGGRQITSIQPGTLHWKVDGALKASNSNNVFHFDLTPSMIGDDMSCTVSLECDRSKIV